MCCLYIYIYTHTHTHTHQAKMIWWMERLGFTSPLAFQSHWEKAVNIPHTPTANMEMVLKKKKTEVCLTDMIRVEHNFILVYSVSLHIIKLILFFPLYKTPQYCKNQWERKLQVRRVAKLERFAWSCRAMRGLDTAREPLQLSSPGSPGLSLRLKSLPSTPRVLFLGSLCSYFLDILWADSPFCSKPLTPFPSGATPVRDLSKPLDRSSLSETLSSLLRESFFS